MSLSAVTSAVTFAVKAQAAAAASTWMTVSALTQYLHISADVTVKEVKTRSREIAFFFPHKVSGCVENMEPKRRVEDQLGKKSFIQARQKI